MMNLVPRDILGWEGVSGFGPIADSCLAHRDVRLEYEQS